MKKRNTLAVILAMLLVCGSASVYAFGGMNKGNCIRNTATQTKVRCEMAVKAPELTEEQKTEMIEAQRAKLAKMLEDGKITQEEYDEYVSKLDAGEFVHIGNGKDFFAREGNGKTPDANKSKKNFFSGTAMTKPLHGTDSKINNIGRRR